MQNLRLFLQQLEIVLAIIFSGRVSNPAIEDLRVRLRNSLLYLTLVPVMVYIVHLIWNESGMTVAVSLVGFVLVVLALFNVRRLITAGVVGALLHSIGFTPQGQQAPTWLLERYYHFATLILFWELVVLFFTPLLNLQDSPLIGAFIIFGAIPILIQYPEGNTFRQLSCAGIMIVLILMFLRLISPAVWIKSAGLDPFWALRTTASDQALADLHKTKDKLQDNRATARLRLIQNKIERGIQLTPEDKKFLKEQNRSLLERVLGSTGKVDGNILVKVDPLLDIDMSASKGTNTGSGDLVIAPGGKAVLKFFLKNVPPVTETKPVELILTLKPSGSKYLYFTINGKRYQAFLDTFGRSRFGMTSDSLTDINSLVIEGDGDLIINGKEEMTFARF